MKKLNDSRKQEILDRFKYQVPSEAQKELLDEAYRRTIYLVEFLTDYVPDSRNRALALTELERVQMDINKAIIHAEVD